MHLTNHAKGARGVNAVEDGRVVELVIQPGQSVVFEPANADCPVMQGRIRSREFEVVEDEPAAPVAPAAPAADPVDAPKSEPVVADKAPTKK